MSRKRSRPRPRAWAGAILSLLLMSVAACTTTDDEPAPAPGPPELPEKLGFDFERPDVGQPLTAAEITDFTRKLTGFWKKVGFFPWVLRTSHGVHESTGKRDYMVWWGGVDAYREGDVVRFYHADPDGGGHNIMIPTPRVLASAIAGMFLTGDAAMAQVAEQYCKGITATMLGMVYDDSDPLKHLMARNIATFNHSYQTDEGYQKEIDYSGWYASYDHWNTSRFEYPDNPTWGSVWVTNMRSKDDVPHIFMAVPHIAFAAERAESDEVKEACGETLEYLQAFTRDIVEQGYRIRTKDAAGEPFLPGYTGDVDKDNAAGDLASFVMWDGLTPGGECNAKRTSALIGLGDGQGLDCGDGGINLYEIFATHEHYYNYAIVRFFHLAHIANALIKRDDAAALLLLQGLAARLDEYFATPEADLPCSLSEWQNDLALLALRGAAFGLPLTSREAGLIQEKWGRGVDELKSWEHWDLWQTGLADGQYPIRPDHVLGDEHWTRIEDMALVLEYCWSPLRNPAGVRLVDCDLVADPSSWDESYLD